MVQPFVLVPEIGPGQEMLLESALALRLDIQFGGWLSQGLRLELELALALPPA
jgi:hypothetical protein